MREREPSRLIGVSRARQAGSGAARPSAQRAAPGPQGRLEDVQKLLTFTRHGRTRTVAVCTSRAAICAIKIGAAAGPLSWTGHAGEGSHEEWCALVTRRRQEQA